MSAAEFSSADASATAKCSVHKSPPDNNACRNLSHAGHNIRTLPSEKDIGFVTTSPTVTPTSPEKILPDHTTGAALSPFATQTSGPLGVDYPEGGRAAWLVVLGSFCGMMACFGLMNSVGTFQAYLSTHQLAAYSDDAIGWIFSLYVFLSFFCGLQIGSFFDHHGPRLLLSAGSLCLVGGLVALASSTEYWHFILSLSVLCGLGTALTFTPCVAAIGHFFYRRRGVATGLATTGGSIGGIIFPLALPPLIATHGYATAVRVLALLVLILAVIACILVRARRPPPRSLPPVEQFAGQTTAPIASLLDIAFVLTTAGVFAVEWGLFVPLTYLPSAGSRAGLDPHTASLLPAVLNAGSVVGRALPGYLADRTGRFNCMIATVAGCALATAGLWLPAVRAHGPGVAAPATRPLTLTFALLFGAMSGSNISLAPVCVGQLCDTSAYGRYYATCYAVVSFGCLTGVPIAGALLKTSGDVGVVAFTTACYVVGLACFIAVRVRRVGWQWNKVF